MISSFLNFLLVSETRQLFDNIHMIKSPLYLVQIGVFIIANCSLTLSLNVINELMFKATNGDQAEYVGEFHV